MSNANYCGLDSDTNRRDVPDAKTAHTLGAEGKSDEGRLSSVWIS